MARTLTEDQQLLKDSVARFVADKYDISTRRGILETAQAHSPEIWREIAELGWLGALLPEDQGGFDGGSVELAILMEELGRGLVLEPVMSNLLFGCALLARHGKPEQCQSLLGEIAGGQTKIALAYLEPDSRNDPFWIAATATPEGDSFRLNGHKSLVLDGAIADKLIVSARTDGAPGSRDGISLFIVDAASEGVYCQDFRTFDGLRASEITFENVLVPSSTAIGEIGGGGAILEEIVNLACIATCAEAVGAMQALFDMLLDYLRNREQFGKPISKFQALQHRAAEMFAALQQARDLTERVATAFAGVADDESDRLLAATKIQVNTAAALIGCEGVQMHGAIGLTDEYAASHYFKRLEAIETLWGDSDYHLGKIIADY